LSQKRGECAPAARYSPSCWARERRIRTVRREKARMQGVTGVILEIFGGKSAGSFGVHGDRGSQATLSLPLDRSDGEKDGSVIPDLREQFNRGFLDRLYVDLLSHLRQASGTEIEFRVAETPVFVPRTLLDEMAEQGRVLATLLIDDPEYLAAARRAIPAGYDVANQTPRPHFLTADFALIRRSSGGLAPRLVEIQAFPSVFAYQALLCDAYREVYGLPDNLGAFLSGLDAEGYWELFARTVLGGHDPKHVVLTEVDPLQQKTRPDFYCTAKRLGIAVVDISELVPINDKLHYRDADGRLVPIERIYNRAIADELIGRDIRLPFDLTHPWNVEWAGHPNWYFLISKFSLPWLTDPAVEDAVVPPAVYLSDFLEGPGRARLAALGVDLPADSRPETIYRNLLLKPLFSFAGKGIEFEPTHAQLEAIPKQRRSDFLLQQRMTFVPTIDTPHGITQAEFRILYLWPNGGSLTPALSLVRLGRGKMMGVDHNKDQSWVGASAAFFPTHSPAPVPLAATVPRKS